MSSYLLRVGLDSTAAGGEGHPPVNRSGEFEYIPIPEQCDTTESRTYRDLGPRLDNPIEEYVGVDPDTPVHCDPEFETYTYGEVTDQKCSSLRRLNEGDLLVFCAALQPQTELEQVRPRMYAVGYFTVDRVYDLERIPPERRADLLEDDGSHGFSNNAHVRRTGLEPDSLHPDDPDRDRYPVLVSGKSSSSRLLDRAVPLSSATATGTGEQWYQKYRPLGVVDDILGLNATDLKRSNLKKIRASQDEVRQWLEGDSIVETNKRYPPPSVYTDRDRDQDIEPDGTPKLRSYVVSSDSNFAPHIRNGLLSLATCKPVIRSSSLVGDWVMGFGGSDHDSDRQLVHAFRAEQTISMREYFLEDQYASRRPTAESENPRGDNIYVPREIVEKIEWVGGTALPSDAGADADGKYERGYVGDELCYTHPDGEYFQLAGGGHDLGNYSTDVEKQGDRECVLLSSDFYYFGDSGVEIPRELASVCVPGYGPHGGRRGHRTEPCEYSSILPVIHWLRNSFRPGWHGEPASVGTDLDPEETTGPGC